MRIISDYKPGLYTKENPFEFNGKFEDIIYTNPNIGSPTDRSLIPAEVYIKYKCVDCGKEVAVRVASIRAFHNKVMKGKKDPCQDGLLCKGCKDRRLNEKLGRESGSKRSAKRNKETFFKNHPKYTPFSSEPILIKESWEEFINSGRTFNMKQKLKYSCEKCGKETTVVYGTLRTRKVVGINSGFYCKKCSAEHYKEFGEADNPIILFEGNNIEDFRKFKEENNLTTDHAVKMICPVCKNLSY